MPCGTTVPIAWHAHLHYTLYARQRIGLRQMRSTGQYPQQEVFWRTYAALLSGLVEKTPLLAEILQK